MESAAWEHSFGTSHLGIVAWHFPLRNSRLGTFAWDLSLGPAGKLRLVIPTLLFVCLGDFVWGISFRDFYLGSFAPGLSLGLFGLDKLADVDGAVAKVKAALDAVQA